MAKLSSKNDETIKLSNAEAAAAAAGGSTTSAFVNEVEKKEREIEDSCDGPPKSWKERMDLLIAKWEDHKRLRVDNNLGGCFTETTTNNSVSEDSVTRMNREHDKIFYYGDVDFDKIPYVLNTDLPPCPRDIDDTLGFYVDPSSNNCALRKYARAVSCGVDSRVHILAKIALGQFDPIHPELYELVRVIKANWRVARGCMYYITFQAIKAGSELITFQARVRDFIPAQELEVQLCRIKPPPPPSP